MNQSYDFIICGMGCAGLNLAYHLCHPFFHNKKILLINKEKKNQNDRTWCFWESSEGPFQSIVIKEWEYLWFHNEKLSKRLEIKPFSYKMIKGIDFYNFTLEKIKKQAHIDIAYQEIKEITQQNEAATVSTNLSDYTGKFIFSSLFKGTIDKEKHNYVDQHFMGWFVKTSQPTFDQESAVFMDFRIDQKGECRFLYVLPLNSQEALVEVAIFSNNVLKREDYEAILEVYCREQLRIPAYQILETEFGVIPMTTYPFEHHNTNNIIHLGTAGGVAKASTGYAFKRIQDHTAKIVDLLRQKKSPYVENSFFKNRFRWYDNILLNVLLKERYPLSLVFGDLFESTKAPKILSFLNNESSLFQDLGILKCPPILPFINAAFDEF